MKRVLMIFTFILSAMILVAVADAALRQGMSETDYEAAIKEIKDTSIKIAVNSVKKIITTSVDKSKLDNLFEKNLEEAKSELRKINS